MVEMGQELENNAPDPSKVGRHRWKRYAALPVKGDNPPTVGDVARTIKDIEKSKTMDRMMEMQDIVDPRYNYMLLYLLVITVMWFGCNNAAKEIVKEEAVYGRERAVNLGILPYLGSKFLLPSIVRRHCKPCCCSVWFSAGCTCFTSRLAMAEPFPGYRLDFASEFGVMVLLLAMVGVASGLLLVRVHVNSPDRASTLLPYVLIPQIVHPGRGACSRSISSRCAHTGDDTVAGLLGLSRRSSRLHAIPQGLSRLHWITTIACGLCVWHSRGADGGAARTDGMVPPARKDVGRA